MVRAAFGHWDGRPQASKPSGARSCRTAPPLASTRTTATAVMPGTTMHIMGMTNTPCRLRRGNGQGSRLRDDGGPAHREAPGRTLPAGRTTTSARTAAKPSSRPTLAATSPPGRSAGADPSPRARSTPARCTRRSGRSGPGHARSAGWRLSRPDRRGDEGPSAELVDMTRRFWIGLVLTLPVFVLEMGGHLFGLSERLGQQTSNCIQFALATRSCSGPAGRSSCAAIGPWSLAA